MRTMKTFLLLLSLMVHINEQTAQPFYPDLGPHGFRPAPSLHGPILDFNGLPMHHRRLSHADSSRFDSRDRHRSRDRMIDPYDQMDGRGHPRMRLRDRPIETIDRHEQRPRSRDAFEPLDRPRSRTRMTDRLDPIERSSSRRRGRDPINQVDRRRSNSHSSDPYDPLPLDKPSSRHSSSERRDPYDRRTTSQNFNPPERQLSGFTQTRDNHNGVRRNEQLRGGTGSEARRHFDENSRLRPNQAISNGRSNRIENRSFQNRGQNPPLNDLHDRGQNHPIQSNQMAQGQFESDVRNTQSIRPETDPFVSDQNTPSEQRDRGPLIPNRTQQQQSHMQIDQGHNKNSVRAPVNHERPTSNNNRQPKTMPVRNHQSASIGSHQSGAQPISKTAIPVSLPSQDSFLPTGQIAANERTHTGIKQRAIDNAIVEPQIGTTPGYEIIYVNISDSSHGPNIAEFAQLGHPPELLAALDRVLRKPSISHGAPEATTVSSSKDPGLLKQQTLRDFNTLSASDRQQLLTLLQSTGGLSAVRQSIQTIQSNIGTSNMQTNVGNSARTQAVSPIHASGVDQTTNTFSAKDRQRLLALLQPQDGRGTGTQQSQTIQSNVGNSLTSQSLSSMHSIGLGQPANTLSESQRQMLLTLLQTNGGRSAEPQPLPNMHSTGLDQIMNPTSQLMSALLPSTVGQGMGPFSLPNMQTDGQGNLLNNVMNRNVGGHGLGSMGGGQGLFGNSLSMRDFLILEGLS